MHPAPSRRLAALVGATGLLVSLGAGPVLAATPTAGATSTATSTPTAAGEAELEGEACPEGEGATVLVDPQGLAGGELAEPTAGCALEAADGLTALEEAGFTATESQPGFVCTIESVPAPEQADCTTDGYWAYYYAPRDGEWTASQVGAADRVPEAGGVEAWSWTELSGDDLVGAAPRVDPAAVAGLPVAGEEGADEAQAEEVGESADESVPVVTIAIIVVVAVLVVLAIVLGGRYRRRQVEQEMDDRRSHES
ncbi:hypothetical protein [uncultured Pseudokineococcus sp.]|uniref:hypothetical protein n=1 Tax=uncultured Pseudokineococcus sp. TaxID=1642928 RepID=UPI0026386CEE|nr:hypothetical protein [uncultured Pseudokineococcus sp.]